MEMRSDAAFWICSVIAIVAASLALLACKGSPSSPSEGGVVATITITNTGVSPGAVSILPGQRVRFVNNSSSNRQINSNPFPAHSDCPPINNVSLLTPGESKETGPLTFVGACGFHDHLTEGDPTFSGQVLVGTSDPGTAPPSGYY
jgi:hypothetical protein